MRLLIAVLIKAKAGWKPAAQLNWHKLTEPTELEPEALADFLLSNRLAPQAQRVHLIQPLAVKRKPTGKLCEAHRSVDSCVMCLLYRAAIN